MERDARELSMIMRQLPQAREQMMIAMRNLSRSWEGPAWETFQAQVYKDMNYLEEVIAQAAQLEESLAKGREIYLRAEFDVYSSM